MPRITGYSYTSRSYNKKVARTGEPIFIRAADTLEDQENVASRQVTDARDMATAQILQDLFSKPNISQECLVTSLGSQLKNSGRRLYRSRKKMEAFVMAGHDESSVKFNDKRHEDSADPKQHDDHSPTPINIPLCKQDLGIHLVHASDDKSKIIGHQLF